MDPSIAIPGYGLIEAFFTVGSTLLVGFALGYVCVGLFVYDYVDDNEEEISEEDKKFQEDMKYQNLYYDEYDKLEEMELDKESLVELRSLYVDEETSRGRVILTYNSDTESFWYWTDNKNINYRLLDTVARKFTLDYNCKQICISYRDELNKADHKNKVEEYELKKAKAENEKNNESQENKEENKEKQVFAQFKSYNVKADNKKEKNIDESRKQYVLAEKANRFSYKGSIEIYEKMQNKDKENPEKQENNKQQIDFATFKKMTLRSDANKIITNEPTNTENTSTEKSTTKKIKIL